jgi:hypothetical protein
VQPPLPYICKQPTALLLLLQLLQLLQLLLLLLLRLGAGPLYIEEGIGIVVDVCLLCHTLL